MKNERKSNKGKTSILSNILLLTIAIILFLALFEAVVRTFNIASDYGATKGMYQKDDLLDYGMTPSFKGKFTRQEFSVDVSTNSLGLRDVEYSGKKPDDYRILALGDSFTWGAYGTSLNQTFVKVLERELNGNPDKLRYQVINAGVPGYGTDQELIYLENKGYELKPDLVILNFFVGNDFNDNMQSGEFTVEGGVLVSKKLQISTPEKIRGFFLVHFHSYRLAEKGAIVLFDNFIQAHIRGKLQQGSYEKQLFLEPASSEINNQFAATKRLLDEMNSYVKAHDMKLAVVVIPLDYQANENQKESFIKNNFNENQKYDMEQPQKAVTEWARQNNVFAIDLLPELQKINNSGNLYWNLNAHFNVKGNEAVAEIIHSKLLSSLNLIKRNK